MSKLMFVRNKHFQMQLWQGLWPPVRPNFCIRQHTSAHVSTRQHTPAYVSIRQHTSAYVGIRQHNVLLQSHASAGWIPLQA
jgi:hypothetical protein